MLLNILEIYGTLLFHTPHWSLLQAYLPKGSQTQPYPWTGLNTANPLSQYCRGIQKSHLGRNPRRHKYFWQNYHRTRRNTLFIIRAADPSKGDKRTVEVMCSVCRNPRSYFVNEAPRYEISSGKYVNERRFCRDCRTLEKITFVPVDASMPSTNYSTVLLCWENRESPSRRLSGTGIHTWQRQLCKKENRDE
jgi:hypothetical protein